MAETTSSRGLSAGGVIFGLWAWCMLLVAAAPVILLLALMPGLERRRTITRLGARAFFAGAFIPTRIEGLEQLPADPCVVVANHASYLDGILLTAVLPPRFGFVIKREMTRVPFAHFLLRRINAQFVERADAGRRAADTRRILQLAHEQRGLAFFPEGTFRAEPGLRRFHTGAFLAASRAGMPVVPAVIRGSRAILPAHCWLLRRGCLEVLIRPPITAPHTARALAQLSRRSILECLDEPDLAPDARADAPNPTDPRAAATVTGRA